MRQEKQFWSLIWYPQPHRRQRIRPLRQPRHPRTQIRPPHFSHQFAPSFWVPFAVHPVAALRTPRPRQRWRSTAANSDQSQHRKPTLRTESNIIWSRRFLCESSRTKGLHSHFRRCCCQQSRPRTLREILPQLHPQTVGNGPVGTRQISDCPRANSY